MFIREGTKVKASELLKVWQFSLVMMQPLRWQSMLKEVRKILFMSNEYAEDLQMQNTSFNNASTSDPLNVTSVYDLALLTGRLLKISLHYQLYSEKSYTYNGISQKNRNRLYGEMIYLTVVKLATLPKQVTV